MNLKVNFDVTNIESFFINSYFLIQKFNDKNNIKLHNVLIHAYFENSTESGKYVYENDKKVCVIYINVERCINSKINTQYYPYDLRMENVVIHEYCHFLDDIYNILDKYKKQNFKQFFIKYLNRREEVAELLTIFLLNPYLLKLLDLDRYEFFNEIFKPITYCTRGGFFKQYKKWNRHEKMNFKRIYKLNINQKTKSVNVKKNYK